MIAIAMPNLSSYNGLFDAYLKQIATFVRQITTKINDGKEREKKKRNEYPFSTQIINQFVGSV